MKIPFTNIRIFEKEKPQQKATYLNVGGLGLNSRSGGSKYRGGLASSGQTTNYDHWTMRQNARGAFFDSPQAHALITRRADISAGVGLRLESMPDYERLGITSDAAEKWASDVEKRFEAFAKDKKQNRSESMSLNQAERLYELNDDRDGENFIRLYYSNDKKILSPLQFEFIDPNQIRGAAWTTSSGPMICEDGISRDARGREKSYKVWIQNYKTKKFEYVTVPRIGEKSGKVFMLHGFQPWFSGQKRGFSKIGHILQEFENITDFSLATIKKAIAHSNLIMYTENDKQDPGNPLEDLPKRRTTMIGAYGSNPIPDGGAEGVTEESTAPIVDWCAIPEATIDQPGGVSLFSLSEGDKLKAFESNTPPESFDKFVDSFTSYLSSSTGRPLEVIKMQFNQNYSASRAALVLFWQVVLLWRHERITDFNNPLYEIWLSLEIAAGRIQAPGWSDPQLRSAWLKCEWYGSPMPNIDPAREARAQKEYLDMSATNQDRISRNVSGNSAKSNIIKNTKYFEMTPQTPWNKNKNGGK